MQQFQLVSGSANAGGSPQVVQISQGQGGQRLAVPLKLLLQPQVGQSVHLFYGSVMFIGVR